MLCAILFVPYSLVLRFFFCFFVFFSFLWAQLHSSILAFVVISMMKKSELAEKSNSLNILAILPEYQRACVPNTASSSSSSSSSSPLLRIEWFIAISSNRFNWLYCEQLNLFSWARWIYMYAFLNINTMAMGKTIKFAFVFPSINLKTLTTKSFAWLIRECEQEENERERLYWNPILNVYRNALLSCTYISN